MSTCHCFKGVTADPAYIPQGAVSTLAGLPIYTSVPPKNVQRCDETILILPDGFGLARHNKRLADLYAQCGYETTIIDYFEGDALPDFFMLYVPGTDLDAYANITTEQKDIIRKIDMSDWGNRHSPERVSSLMQSVFPAYCESLAKSRLQSGHPPARVHVVGHCFGGKHAFRLAKQNDTVASVVIFHPSFLESADLQGLQRPVLVGCAETDVFTPDLVSTMMAQLPTSGTTWKLLVYGSTIHGFASRADLGDEWTAKMFEQAFNDGLQWLQTKWPEK